MPWLMRGVKLFLNFFFDIFTLYFQLREEWESGQDAALDSAVCPHDVATLLKEFLRDLPDPLLCKDLYTAFLQTQSMMVCLNSFYLPTVYTV